jgi:hypothetical protein
MEQLRDEILWKHAKKRVGFKNHLATYIVINLFLWGMWYFTAHQMESEEDMNTPWPVFCTLGWGIGIAFDFISTYVIVNNISSIEKEYQKLKGRA